jgi:oxygen-independent coproporphyrinogen III oxidase
VVISLYFHIPFCSKKCPYCHFYVLPDEAPLKALLLEGLALEWRQKLSLLQGKKITSVYFGGGTPTLLGAKGIEALLKMVDPPPCELTIEANPENSSPSLAKDLFSLGINRVSLGVQSLDNSSLEQLGRGHSGKCAVDAIDTFYAAGLENISIDLMYDIPHQTRTSWAKTVRQIAHLPIKHLSLYNLTLEPGTSFFKRKEALLPHIPSDIESLAMLSSAAECFESLGLTRYEISAFAREGFRSHHNTGYWTGRPFLGYGPSAFSYFDKKRFRNRAHLKKYTESLQRGISPVDFEEELSFPQSLHELLAIGLRLLEGVNIADFQRAHGTFCEETWEKIKILEEQKLLDLKRERLKLSEKGLLFYDSVAETLI